MSSNDTLVVHRSLLWALLIPAFTTMAIVLSAAQGQSAQNYVIGAKDVLAIVCLEDSALNGKYTVEADGSFTLPYIGVVKAADLTIRQVEAEIRKRLKDGEFIRNPQLAVTIDQYRSQYVILIGEVGKPGIYPLTGGMTLLDLIAQAGTLNATASGSILIVPAKAAKADLSADGLGQGVTTGDAESGIVRADLSQLQRGILDRTIELHDGDTVIAPRAESAYIIGEVKSPGAYPVPGDITVQQLLALAGGQTVDAALNRIKIARLENGVPKEIKNVKLTEIVKPGDMVIVPTKRF